MADIEHWGYLIWIIIGIVLLDILGTYRLLFYLILTFTFGVPFYYLVGKPLRQIAASVSAE